MTRMSYMVALRIGAAAAALAVAIGATPIQRQTAAPIAPQDLARIWDEEHVSPPVPALLDHDDVEHRLQAIAERDPARFVFERVGASLEGRSINMITTGQGSTRVLLWSQMHGDEPTATAALFDVFEYFERHRTDDTVRRIMSSLTLYIVPMLNPDGAERFQRRNAQGIDVNRDALRLQTPEGRLLKQLRDRFNPTVGFNLHNQSWRTSVGDPPKPASISLLSVAYDKSQSENAGRKLTKRICAVIRDALEPFASGQIGKYDEDFEVRAFGDNLTLWGTPVVLIETGGYPSSEPDPSLVRLNFIGILAALDALATGAVDRADAKLYENLPKNESREFFVLVQNATVMNGAGTAPFTADIGLTASRRVRVTNGRRELQLTASIDDLGDLRTAGAMRTIDAAGLVAAPLTDDSIRQGQEIVLPNWSQQPSARTIAPGQPADIMLLRPLGDPSRPTDRYQVELVLHYSN
jgi:Zinc carboxypeptidase